jgi:small conductance mechanosensitive channel
LESIAPILAAGIVGLAFGSEVNTLSEILFLVFFIILENQYRVGDIVNFDNAGGTVQEISLRKTTLRDLDGTVHHIPHGEKKSIKSFQRFSVLT